MQHHGCFELLILVAVTFILGRIFSHPREKGTYAAKSTVPLLVEGLPDAMRALSNNTGMLWVLLFRKMIEELRSRTGSWTISLPGF